MNKKHTQEHYPVMTVLGKDKKGIVSQVSSFLWNNKVNIEEIQQGIMKGNFFMVMSLDISECSFTMPELADELKKLGNKIGVKISIYDQTIFQVMHKI